MLRTLATHPDDRVALECCHALELLALFRPNDPWLAAPETIGTYVRCHVPFPHSHITHSPTSPDIHPPTHRRPRLSIHTNLHVHMQHADFLRTALQGGHSARRLACAADPFLAPLTAAAAYEVSLLIGCGCVAKCVYEVGCLIGCVSDLVMVGWVEKRPLTTDPILTSVGWPVMVSFRDTTFQPARPPPPLALINSCHPLSSKTTLI